MDRPEMVSDWGPSICLQIFQVKVRLSTVNLNFIFCPKRLECVGCYRWALKCPEAGIRHTRHGHFKMEMMFLEADHVGDNIG